MSELKPCPHCGGKAEISYGIYEDDDALETYEGYAVTCRECGYTADGFVDLGDAVRAFDSGTGEYVNE